MCLTYLKLYSVEIFCSMYMDETLSGFLTIFSVLVKVKMEKLFYKPKLAKEG